MFDTSMAIRLKCQNERVTSLERVGLAVLQRWPVSPVDRKTNPMPCFRLGSVGVLVDQLAARLHRAVPRSRYILVLLLKEDL